MKDSVWRAGARGIDPQHNSAATQDAQGRRTRERRREPGKIRAVPVAMCRVAWPPRGGDGGAAARLAGLGLPMEGQVLDNTCIYM